MTGFLKVKNNYSWETTGIDFVLKQRAGKTEKCLQEKGIPSGF